ncbi:MAG: hypothetical protein IJ706_09655, partial [Clostridia bacterium]|nr:hypothetical protein [Clostridia bacterium]
SVIREFKSLHPSHSKRKNNLERGCFFRLPCLRHRVITSSFIAVSALRSLGKNICFANTQSN